MSPAAPCFPFLNSTAAPPPTDFWGDSAKSPFPTNEPWQNFVLNEGTAPETVQPYLVRPENSTSQGGLSFCKPTPNSQPGFIIQAFVADLLLTTLEGLLPHRIAGYDDLSVTLSWRSRSSPVHQGPSVVSPLVRGSPYLTFIFSGNASTPVFKTIHAVQGFSSNFGKTKHRVSFNNSQTWLIYSSAPLPLDSNLASTSPFSGVIRVAVLPDSEADGAEHILDAYAPVYPTGGTGSINGYQVDLQWNSTSWSPGAPSTNLLMLTYPIHRRLGLFPSPSTSNLTMSTLDGDAVGTVGCAWKLNADMLPTDMLWHSLNGINAATPPETVQALKNAVGDDVNSLAPLSNPSSYFYGKAISRAARLALIAEELGMLEQVKVAQRFLKTSLSDWLLGKVPGNQFMYDTVWGGVVPEQGANDQGADFGAGLYNDHHFHYGYFVYAAAVLAKLDSAWAEEFKPQVTTLIRDYMSPEADEFFPKLRHFDFFALHSWASGLFEFFDGRNQESSSEAVNAYYAAALWGKAIGDNGTEALGFTLASIETVATEMLWHVPSGIDIYPDPFRSANSILGIVWCNKRDSGLWFAPPERLEIRTGIQVLPITPFTSILFRRPKFSQQLVTWTTPALSDPAATDEWKGFTWALQAMTDRTSAVKNIRALTAFDDGNSLSNTLWFALTQP